MVDELPLKDWLVAVPESRQLDVLNDMLTVRGASTLRCPLVSIHDAPNDADIQAWLTTFCRTDFDDFIILTGEGIRRLTGFAERFGIKDDWVAALARVRKIARGPKPASALRPLQLKPDVLAVAPTTEGVIATLASEDLAGRKMAVQLYGEEPNHKLQDFLRERGAELSLVAPYIYASDSESSAVSSLIDKLIAAEIDVLVLTSIVQVKRIMAVAKQEGREEAALQGLRQTHIAAIGPIVAEQLNGLNIPIAVIPEDKFFMKPLVRKLVDFVQQNPKI
ncbi:MAG TPA: uroporphyrinogen-III synthase [Marinagarivorans sp.]